MLELLGTYWGEFEGWKKRNKMQTLDNTFKGHFLINSCMRDTTEIFFTMNRKGNLFCRKLKMQKKTISKLTKRLFRMNNWCRKYYILPQMCWVEIKKRTERLLTMAFFHSENHTAINTDFSTGSFSRLILFSFVVFFLCREIPIRLSWIMERIMI